MQFNLVTIETAGVKGTYVCTLKINHNSEAQIKTKKSIFGITKCFHFVYDLYVLFEIHIWTFYAYIFIGNLMDIPK